MVEGVPVIRLVEVLATLKRAGAEMMVSSLVARLDRSRFEPHVVTLFDGVDGDLEDEVRGAGVAVHRLGKRPGLDVRMYRRLRSVIRRIGPDIVHTHSYVLRYVLPVAGAPIVHTVHNLADREVDRVGRWIHRAAFRMGVTPVAVSGEVARTFASEYGFAPAIIPNGIDVSRFAGSHEDGRVFTVLSVARLEPQKNPVLLADAVDGLGFEARLVLAGEGSLRAVLAGRRRVELLGVRRDVGELLRCADVFALASDYEGHPIALMEAMAAGVPVVATAVGGVPEIVGDAGLLISPGDRGAMTAAIARLHDDAGLRTDLGRRARVRAAGFDIGVMVAAYSRLFEEVVPGR